MIFIAKLSLASLKTVTYVVCTSSVLHCWWDTGTSAAGAIFSAVLNVIIIVTVDYCRGKGETLGFICCSMTQYTSILHVLKSWRVASLLYRTMSELKIMKDKLMPKKTKKPLNNVVQ